MSCYIVAYMNYQHSHEGAAQLMAGFSKEDDAKEYMAEYNTGEEDQYYILEIPFDTTPGDVNYTWVEPFDTY